MDCMQMLDVSAPGVKAGVSLRRGGFSKAPYDSLNLGLHVNDSPESVARNRELLTRYWQRPVVYMNQTHSNAVKLVSEYTAEPIEADGTVTASDSFMLAVMTADCLPLILYMKDGSACAAVHCGWRGIAGGIVQNAVKLMRTLSDAEILAALGPAIGPRSFEVGPEVRARFTALDPQNSAAFIPGRGDRLMCDIYKLCKNALSFCGVTSVTGGTHDTYKESGLFFSYRRDRVTGRMATCVGLNFE